MQTWNGFDLFFHKFVGMSYKIIVPGHCTVSCLSRVSPNRVLVQIGWNDLDCGEAGFRLAEEIILRIISVCSTYLSRHNVEHATSCNFYPELRQEKVFESWMIVYILLESVDLWNSDYQYTSHCLQILCGIYTCDRTLTRCCCWPNYDLFTYLWVLTSPL
jgi:hypothetical protein